MAPLVNVVLRTIPGLVEALVVPIKVASAVSNCADVEVADARSEFMEVATPESEVETDTKMARPETALRRVTAGDSIGSRVIKPTVVFEMPDKARVTASEVLERAAVAATNNDITLYFIILFFLIVLFSIYGRLDDYSLESGV